MTIFILRVTGIRGLQGGNRWLGLAKREGALAQAAGRAALGPREAAPQGQQAANTAQRSLRGGWTPCHGPLRLPPRLTLFLGRWLCCAVAKQPPWDIGIQRWCCLALPSWGDADTGLVLTPLGRHGVIQASAATAR